jgi:FkbM family methyltransferase
MLDRRGLRSAMEPAVSYLARARGRGVRKIFYDDGVWIHETDNGYFAYHQPFVRLDMARLDELAKRNFLWGYTPRNGDTVMDVGAGVGEEALMFSRVVGPQGRVICIEAHPRTSRCLKKLAEYNRLENLIVISQAVAAPSCSLITVEDSSDYLGNRTGVADGISVVAATVDVIYRQLGLSKIHFLKMNIEGAERFAIQGMAETLRHTEVLCICCHDFLVETTQDESLKTKSAVMNFMQHSGFKILVRKDPGLPDYVRDQVWAYSEQARQMAG